MPTDSPARWSAIILAAGEGTRMKSKRPKVLHEIAGRALLSWVVQAALDAGAARCLVVVGHGRDDVERVLRTRFGQRVEMVLQPEQRGTGDAVRCAIEADIELEGRVLVLYGGLPSNPGCAAAESDRALGSSGGRPRSRHRHADAIRAATAASCETPRAVFSESSKIATVPSMSEAYKR